MVPPEPSAAGPVVPPGHGPGSDLPPWGSFGPAPGLPPAFDVSELEPGGLSRASGPGMAMMVVGIVSALLDVACLGLVVAGAAFTTGGSGGSGVLPEMLASMLVQIIFVFFGLVLAGLATAGGLQMRRQRNYGLALAGAIAMLVPCGWPCCVLSLPFGIWAVVVLSDANVKASFR